LQCKRMELASHFGLQGLVDELMLLHPGLATESLRKHRRRIVVAVAGKIADRHLGIWDTRFDQPLDVVGLHRHCDLPCSFAVPEHAESLRICINSIRKSATSKDHVHLSDGRPTCIEEANFRIARAIWRPKWDVGPVASMSPHQWCRSGAPEYSVGRLG